MTTGPRRKGTGGHGKRRLAGKGPTPAAHLRPGHPARRRAAAEEKRATGAGRDETSKLTLMTRHSLCIAARTGKFDVRMPLTNARAGHAGCV